MITKVFVIAKRAYYLRVKLLVSAFVVAAPVPLVLIQCRNRDARPPADPLFFPSALRCNVGSHRGKPRPRCDHISMAIAAHVHCANKYNYK